jgi:hypothetical protein
MGRIRKIARLPEPVQDVVKSRQVCRAILSAFAPPKGEAIAAKAGQTEVRARQSLAPPQFICKYCEMNNLQQNRPLAGSNSVKPGQTDLRLKTSAFSLLPSAFLLVFAGSSL